MPKAFERAAVVILDGVGCGEAADVKKKYPEDKGVNSLVNASQVIPVDALGLQSMGLEHIPGLERLKVRTPIQRRDVRGAFGALEPTFAGNGSPEGHQSLMGFSLQDPYLLFNRTGIPHEIVELIEAAVEEVMHRNTEVIRYPGTDDISGTVFIEHPNIGPVHLASLAPGQPLRVPLYASSDSLVQIALHQDVVPQDKIEAIGKAVREKLNDGGWRVARVIMRPFIGRPGKFERVSADRRDYGVNPNGPTLVDQLTAAGIPVHSIGKAADMFNGQGFPPENRQKLSTDDERIKAVLNHFRESSGLGFLLANLVYTDEKFGHRRKPVEYIAHINLVDLVLQNIKRAMTGRDLLMIASDHGNDPTHKAHTNHTRERTPLLVYSPRVNEPVVLGIRETFADVAATIADNFDVEEPSQEGESFLAQILQAA